MTFPLVSLTLQALRCAEFGFFGFRTITLSTTPFLIGHLCKSGETVTFLRLGFSAPRLIWFNVAHIDVVVVKVAFWVTREAGKSSGIAGTAANFVTGLSKLENILNCLFKLLELSLLHYEASISFEIFQIEKKIASDELLKLE